MKTTLSLCALLLAAATAPSSDKPIDAQSAFTLLKNLSGEWGGNVTTKDGPSASVTYRVTAGGNTVMETLFPGTGHEMVSMYYLDGANLILKHFCSTGNQPELKLEASTSTPQALNFVFVGGTNFDPQKDVHMHEGQLRILEAGTIEADWNIFKNGAKSGTERFFLKRAEKKN